jgi:hypothetical protein
MPDVHEVHTVTTPSHAETLYTVTEIGPNTPRVRTPRVQGASKGGATASGGRTPRSNRSCLRVQESPAKTPRGKSGKAWVARASRLAAVQHAAGISSPAPETPRGRKPAAALAKKGCAKHVSFQQTPSVPSSALPQLPPSQPQVVCDSLRPPGTPRHSKLTDADVAIDAKLLVGNAVTSQKVPLLPIGRSSVAAAENSNSLVALSPRVLEQTLQDHDDVAQMQPAISAATFQSCQSNDLLAVYSKEDAKMFRKRALDAARKGEQMIDPAGGSWDVGDLGDVAGDWAPSIGTQDHYIHSTCLPLTVGIIAMHIHDHGTVISSLQPRLQLMLHVSTHQSIAQPHCCIIHMLPMSIA